MKIPHSIKWYPLDIKKDTDSKGLWFYIPEWIVRAYKLKEHSTNMGKVAFEIHRDMRAINEYRYEEALPDKLWKENWCKKIMREQRNKREELK